MRKITIMFTCVALIIFADCATVQNFGEPRRDPAYVFAGTRANLNDLGNTSDRVDYCFAKLDFPFSFVLDIILLPVAIPLALTWHEKPDPDEDTSPNQAPTKDEADKK